MSRFRSSQHFAGRCDFDHVTAPGHSAIARIEVHVGAGFKPALLRHTPLGGYSPGAQPQVRVCCASAGWKPAPTSLPICAPPGERDTRGLPQRAVNATFRTATAVSALPQILLQKSFSTTDQNFSGLLMRFLERY